jgi:hypothetical protein
MMSQDKSQNKEILLREFRKPPLEYGPIDCWWWEAEHLTKERMTWQLEEMKAKGVAGTWFYPRFVYEEPLRSDPAYWTEEWWNLTKFAVEELQRLGMYSWFNDWTSHQFFQNKVREESVKNPSLIGKRLIIREEKSDTGIISIEIPLQEEILHASAYKKLGDVLDYSSRIDLMNVVQNNKLTWETKESGWLVTVITSQPNDLNYLDKVTADKWIELNLGVYESKLQDFVGKTLKAYGTLAIDSKQIKGMILLHILLGYSMILASLRTR